MSEKHYQYPVHRRHLLVFFHTKQILTRWEHVNQKPDIQTLSIFTGYSEESILESLEFGHPSLIDHLQGSSAHPLKTAR
ncbi:hypothetical protein [Pontibacillus sp. HMF3514]|uniref:hypothetical protein n=1 Tax=Pontibacillus sp. HMF3514 TaxID=2692425 RepID=UPI00131F8073|nr:hypothetical protein [Pontibacillus sp. HMF3514]QHE53910.1 hypothetical protein GS400_18620 [Pontibacillus sp. HMF3514]